MYKIRLPRQFINFFGRGALLSEQTHFGFAETFDPCSVGGLYNYLAILGVAV